MTSLQTQAMPTPRRSAVGFSSTVAALALALSGVGHGAVVYFGTPIQIPNTYAGVSVDLETGASSTGINGLSGGDANFYYGGAGISNDAYISASAATWQPVRVGTGNTDPVQKLGLNTAVNENTASYSTGFGGSGGSVGSPSPHMDGDSTDFTGGIPGYLGFSLVIGPSGSETTVYGWARVTFEDNTGAGTLHEWAYEDTGNEILVGVPEPGMAMLGALGVLVLLRRRR